MGALRDLVRLVRWSRAQSRPSVADALSAGVQATDDVRAYQDALVSGVVGAHNGVPTTALVEAVTARPATGDGPRRAELVLRIDAPGEPRVTHPEEPPSPVHVGARLPVWVVRFEPRRFAIDWDREAVPGHRA
jgi:hypothetical protein